MKRFALVVLLLPVLAFSQSGEMYMYESAGTKTIDESNSYNLLQGFTTGAVSGITFQANNTTGAITEFADATGGEIYVLDGSHGLTTGDEVSIRGTTNYNGVWTVTVVHADTFKITDTWVADEAAADWDGGSYLQVSAGGTGFYKLNISITGASSGAQATNFKFEVFKNGDEVNTCADEFTSAGTEHQSTGVSGFVSLVIGDRIYLAVKNESNTNDLDMEHANVNLTKL